MSRPGGLAHIAENADGSRSAVWGIYELRTAFQPIFAFNDDGKLVVAAYECLIRPFRAGISVSPNRLFASVPPEDRFEVETLTRNLHLLNASLFVDPPASIFVNFDPSLYATRENIDDALGNMRQVMQEGKLEPSRIVCELTEQKSASPLALRSLMMALRESGFRIAVDDFGADDSDFERIIHMDPDIVKFDAEWVIKLLKSASGYSLLKSMVAKVSRLGIQTVIEGVEEPWQLELTEKTGAVMVQGFGIARPRLASSEYPARREPEQQAETVLKPLPAAPARRIAQPLFGRRQ